MVPTIHTVPTLKKVHMQLVDLGVTYVRHHKNNRLWKYWNDYTEAGLEVWAQEQESEQQKQRDKQEEDSEQNNPPKPDLDDSLAPPDNTAAMDPTDSPPTTRAPPPMKSPDPPADKDPPATLDIDRVNNKEEAYQR